LRKDLLNQQKANCQAQSLVCWSLIRIVTRAGGDKKQWDFLVRGKKEALRANAPMQELK
jgi:hypothetical protein